MMVRGGKRCMGGSVVNSRDKYFVEVGHGDAEADYTGLYPGTDLKTIS